MLAHSRGPNVAAEHEQLYKDVGKNFVLAVGFSHGHILYLEPHDDG